jgi:2-polyprenyl-6-methoxyphenol hydroxylase-like FAD-dependent oxidoreductase
MNIVVAGGSAAGLFTSLLLARAGHSVVLVEQEQLKLADDVDSAAKSAFRAAAPHIVQPHIVMARCRELLIEHLPDIHADLIGAGVNEVPFSLQMPESLADSDFRPGDERLTVLMTRRAAIDWVLQRAVRAEPRVTMRCGLRTVGLLARHGSPPHVTGIRTAEENIPADLVVDAMGYRTPIDHWLKEIEAQPTSMLRAECGVAYFSRHYKLPAEGDLPGPATARLVAGLDEFTAGIWAGDNRTMQLAVAPLAKDHRFKTMRRPEVFTAVLRTVPFFAGWLDVLEPITDIFTMGAVQNTMRRLVVDGSPLVTGLVSVGDSVCTTNPTLGRGLTLALSRAVDLARALAEHGDDPPGQALVMDQMAAERILPFYEDQAVTDGVRLAMLEHTIYDAPLPAPATPVSNRTNFGELRTAAMFDGTALRAFWRIMGMINRPEEVYTDPAVVARTRAVLSEHASGRGMAQPTREQLLAALAT